MIHRFHLDPKGINEKSQELIKVWNLYHKLKEKKVKKEYLEPMKKMIQWQEKLLSTAQTKYDKEWKHETKQN